MASPFGIYARAARNLPLTPGERAFLRAAGGLWQTAAAAAAVAVLQAALNGGHALTFGTLAQIAAVAGAGAAVAGGAKLVRAQGDPVMAPVADALDGVSARLASVAPIGAASRGAPRAQQPTPPALTGADLAWSLPATRRADLLRQAGVTPIASSPGDGMTRPSIASVATPRSFSTVPVPLAADATSAPAVADTATGDGPQVSEPVAVGAEEAPEPVTAQRAAVKSPSDAWTR